MGKVAFIFPGQGSQKTGMGRNLFDNFEVAKTTFEKIDEIMGRKISTLCFDGTAEELKLTINTQPALLAVSIVAFEVLKSEIKIEPSFLAGHSLGEYGALYAAGALDLKSAMLAIGERAELMDFATKEVTGGAMSAVLGLGQDAILECLKKAATKGYVGVANYNDPTQTVITGEGEAVNYAGELLKEAGAKRVIPLPVSGAFHSELMRKAGEEFGEFLLDLTVNDAQIPVITNVDAEITQNASELKEKMSKQIYSSVHWSKTIEKMLNDGVDTFVEIGEGKVLAGLNKKMCPENVKTFNVFDKASLENTLEGLKNG